MDKRTLIIILVSILALCLGVWIFVLLWEVKTQPMGAGNSKMASQEDGAKSNGDIIITDWKTYKNTAYGYELEYPADWEIGTTFGADPQTFSAPVFSPKDCSNIGECPRFSVGNVHEIGKDEVVENGINLNSDDKVIARGETEIAGEKASLLEYYQANYGRKDGGKGLVRQEFKLVHNNTVYRFYIDEYDSDINRIKSSADWRYAKVFEHMLKSFAFVGGGNQTSSSSDPGKEVSGKDEIISIFADEHGKDKDEVTITIKQEEGDFMRGGVEFAPGGIGNSGMFLATKINGKWTVVYEGGGVPDCDKLVNHYGFSQDMLGGICY